MSNASSKPVSHSSENDSPEHFQPGDSPLQPLDSPFLARAGIQLFIKRDDLIHPDFGGNKWRKLKYNLVEARRHKHNTLLTFGGAWSNHIHATAAAGRHFGFNTIGLIRGEETDTPSPTLRTAADNGMQLHFLDRQRYRQKNQPDFLSALTKQYHNPYILPEGGSNSLALQGCAEIVDEIETRGQAFDIICSASGTGATLAGLITRLKSGQRAIGFSALKGGDFLNDEVRRFLREGSGQTNTEQTTIGQPDWSIETRFHFGGYARASDQLLDFIRRFHRQYGIMLDVVYTGKMFYGLWQMIKAGEFPRGSRIIVLHSGGLQGNAGFDL